MTNQFPDQNEWSPGKKIVTLFILAYLFFYMFPFPLDAIPGVDSIITSISKPFDSLNLWIGTHILKMKPFKRIDTTGSGDTSFYYAKLLTQSLLSLIVALLIFLLRRKQKNYSQLLFWVSTYARYYVGLYMVIYGSAKMFDGQFSSPGLSRLEQPYGNSSPMGLLWTFMGYSKGYTMFSGIGEIIGGCLLFFRRTTVLGGMICFGVMMNVAVMNLCYDVPVKLFSLHLELISLFILAPYLKQIFGLFFFSKEVSFQYSNIRLSKRWMRVTRVAGKTMLILGIPALLIAMVTNQETENKESSNSFNGVYRTTNFIANSREVPPLTTDTFRWNKAIIENGYISISTMVDSHVYYKLTTDTVGQKIMLTSYEDSTAKYSFKYSCKTDSSLLISGIFKTDTLSVTFSRKLAKNYRLINRGFHWINEYPYNR